VDLPYLSDALSWLPCAPIRNANSQSHLDDTPGHTPSDHNHDGDDRAGGCLSTSWSQVPNPARVLKPIRQRRASKAYNPTAAVARAAATVGSAALAARIPLPPLMRLPLVAASAVGLLPKPITKRTGGTLRKPAQIRVRLAK